MVNIQLATLLNNQLRNIGHTLCFLNENFIDAYYFLKNETTIDLNQQDIDGKIPTSYLRVLLQEVIKQNII